MSTEEQRARLPKWAQAEMRRLSMERDAAIREMNAVIDDQTPSPFYCDDSVCSGEDRGPSLKRRYFQTYKMQVEHSGICLEVMIRDNEITMAWGGVDRQVAECAMIPCSHQKVRLVTKEHMRA